MTGFFVEPLESLMFGRPQSFLAGEAHGAASQFPPSAYAFQGLLRTHLLHASKHPIDLEDLRSRERIEALVGTPDALKDGWQITGPYPARFVTREDYPVLEPWLPIPRFLVRTDQGIIRVRPLSNEQGGLNDLGVQTMFGRPELGPCETMKGWLSASALWKVLSAVDRDETWSCSSTDWSGELPPFVLRESRPGLAIEPGTATAKDEMLYFLDTLRFSHRSGFWGRLTAPNLDDFEPNALTKGMSSFGRKGRLVRFDAVAEFDPAWRRVDLGEHLPTSVNETDRFWLITLSPLRVEDTRNLTPRISLPPDVVVHVEAALTGSPLVLGGFSLANGAARPNRLYAPAGSAWAIRLLGGTHDSRASALRALHNKHPFGSLEEAAMGFGHIVVGLGPSVDGDEK